jgi:hypothetical protein
MEIVHVWFGEGRMEKDLQRYLASRLFHNSRPCGSTNLWEDDIHTPVPRIYVSSCNRHPATGKVGVLSDYKSLMGRKIRYNVIRTNDPAVARGEGGAISMHPLNTD